MSTFKVQNLTIPSVTYSKNVGDIIQGAAKSYCFFFVNSGTPSVSQSFNQSSLTDNGVGTFTTNLTRAFSTSTYVQAGHGEDNDATGDAFLGRPSTGATKTTTALLFTNHNAGTTKFDPPNASIILFGSS